MKKIFPLFAVLFSILLSSCAQPEPTSFTITVKNEYTTAYIIEVTRQNALGVYEGGINPGETRTFTYNRGTIISEIDFYSGIDLSTMKMIKHFDVKNIRSNAFLLIKNGTITRL